MLVEAGPGDTHGEGTDGRERTDMSEKVEESEGETPRKAIGDQDVAVDAVGDGERGSWTLCGMASRGGGGGLSEGYSVVIAVLWEKQEYIRNSPV